MTKKKLQRFLMIFFIGLMAFEVASYWITEGLERVMPPLGLGLAFGLSLWLEGLPYLFIFSMFVFDIVVIWLIVDQVRLFLKIE